LGAPLAEAIPGTAFLLILVITIILVASVPLLEGGTLFFLLLLAVANNKYGSCFLKFRFLNFLEQLLF
jgi:hypothetical protein